MFKISYYEGQQAPIAQLDRVSGYEPEGFRFDS